MLLLDDGGQLLRRVDEPHLVLPHVQSPGADAALRIAPSAVEERAVVHAAAPRDPRGRDLRRDREGVAIIGRCGVSNSGRCIVFVGIDRRCDRCFLANFRRSDANCRSFDVRCRCARRDGSGQVVRRRCDVSRRSTWKRSCSAKSGRAAGGDRAGLSGAGDDFDDRRRSAAELRLDQLRAHRSRASRRRTSTSTAARSDSGWGPRAGSSASFSRPAAKFELADWQTPAAIDTERVRSRRRRATRRSAFATRRELKNYSNAEFNVRVDRKIELLSKADAEKSLGVTVGDVRMVGYRSTNRLTNVGKQALEEGNGLAVDLDPRHVQAGAADDGRGSVSHRRR